MPDIKRFVTYLYYYENDQKLQMAGFAKVEIRGAQCRLEIHLKAGGLSGKTIPVCLFARERGRMIAMEIGQMTPGQMSGDYKALLKCANIGHSPYHMEDICGMLLLRDDTHMYASCWDDGEIRREAIEMFRPQVSAKAPVSAAPEKPEEQKERVSQPETKEQTSPAEAGEQGLQAADVHIEKMAAAPPETLTESAPDAPETPEQNSLKAEDAPGAPEQNSLEAEELPMRNIITPDFQVRDTIWQHWEQIRSRMTLLHPIEGEAITCVHMELRDIRELPKRYWYLGNNSFLLHGFFNYRYLLFGERVCEGKKELFLGVPGVFRRQEKVMAAIFGFPQFILEKPVDNKEEHFGYWCHIMG